MKKLFPLFGALMTLLPTGVVLATHLPTVQPVAAPTPFTTIAGFLGAICYIGNIVFSILVVTGVVVLLLAAFMFLTSGGSEQKTSQARAMLTYAVVGIIVGLLAKGAVIALGTIFHATATLC